MRLVVPPVPSASLLLVVSFLALCGSRPAAQAAATAPAAALPDAAVVLKKRDV